MSIVLSVIIPSYKDPLLLKTIDSLLKNSGLGDKLEVIPVLDGYWQKVPDDDRIRVVHLGKNRGMRGAINAGVRVSRGKYIMRTDEHCTFGDRYDLILTSQCQDKWIVTPRRYFLDPNKWDEVMDIPPIDYMKLKIVKTSNGGEKFSGVEWNRPDRKDVPIDETMAMQGSVWVMSRKWWDSVIGELQTEGYGPLIQDSHEMVFKTWQKGGKLMVNKNTWHSHKHRDFPRMHNNGTKENPANCDAGYAYSLKVWRDYFEKEIRPKWTT
jgi:glycosyltransferase involved in cell wall biosynthesis